MLQPSTTKGSVVHCKSFYMMHYFHWRALECWTANGSGTTSAALLCQFLATHVSNVSGLQSFTLT